MDLSGLWVSMTLNRRLLRVLYKQWKLFFCFHVPCKSAAHTSYYHHYSSDDDRGGPSAVYIGLSLLCAFT